jgi:hypothetical protein
MRLLSRCLSFTKSVKKQRRPKVKKVLAVIKGSAAGDDPVDGVETFGLVELTLLAKR